MTELEVSKLEIAREYLDAAIEFFLGAKEPFLRHPFGGGSGGVIWRTSTEIPAHFHVSLEGDEGVYVRNETDSDRRQRSGQRSAQ